MHGVDSPVASAWFHERPRAWRFRPARRSGDAHTRAASAHSRLERSQPMRLQLDWTPIEPERAREILAALLDLEGDPRVRRLSVKGKRSPLVFYRHWRLVWLCVENPKGDTDSVQEDVWALVRDGVAPMLLDGTSAPVHTANEDESLQLEDAQVPEYIRWFCFAVRADADKPFALFEKPPPKVPASKKKAAAMAEPLTAKGRGDDGALLYETTVIFYRPGLHGAVRGATRRHDGDGRRRAADGVVPAGDHARDPAARHRADAQRKPPVPAGPRTRGGERSGAGSGAKGRKASTSASAGRAAARRSSSWSSCSSSARCATRRRTACSATSTRPCRRRTRSSVRGAARAARRRSSSSRRTSRSSRRRSAEIVNDLRAADAAS